MGNRRCGRRSLLFAAVSAAMASAGCATGNAGRASTSESSTPPTTLSPTPIATPTSTLTPRYLIDRVFPGYRLFGYSGAPNAPGQGRLGIGDLDDRVIEMGQRAAAFAAGRKIRLLMELIATTVHASPGADGMYRTRVDNAVIDQWLDVARAHDAWLVLNIQPGRARFLDELKAYERWLIEPDVVVALDPEWSVKAGQVPGRVFGSTTGAELNVCSAYLSELVIAHDLPEKVMIYHQLHANIVEGITALKQHAGVVVVNSVDGIGSPAAKAETYHSVASSVPAWVHHGFKLFYEEDVASGGRLMTASEVLELDPVPEYVLFE